MPLRIAIRSLTIVLVVELALEPRVSAFNIWRPHITSSTQIPDLTVAASDHITVTSTPANTATVLHLSTPASTATILHLTSVTSTANPIETTSKTEDTKKNLFESTESVETVVKTKDNQHGTVHVSKDSSNTSTVNYQSTNIENATKTSSIDSRQSIKNDLKTTTETDNATSYPTQPVKVKHLTSTDSTVKDAENDTSSNEDTKNAASSAEDSKIDSESTIPYLKAYKAIDRKRPSEVEITTTEKDNDLLKSAQSHPSLEKAFSISSNIPSLEQLNNDLLSLNTRKPSKSLNVSSFVTRIIPPNNRLTQTPLNVTVTKRSEQPRFDTMSSMRAGFLNYTTRASGYDVTTTKVDIFTSTDKVIQSTEATRSMLNTTMEIRRSETTTNGSISDTDAQMAAEDELNEELMKEAIIRNEQYKSYNKQSTTEKTRIDDDASKAYYIQNPYQKPTESDVDKAYNTQNFPKKIEGGANFRSEDNITDDTLSVKPISTDKSKTTMLYTVSPNYRPMKKIEVQPPKTFARDPDDNSWRNESLSSLGIVFKANNSTKPFTQVLKNKTETEWNSLLDKYNKNSEQELRERLEKMSEKRKSNKKKVDKNGEVTYVDYEESISGEIAAKGDKYQPSLSYPIHEVSPLQSPPRIPNIFSLDTPSSELELNKTTPTSGMKKAVIETFDGDDDDGDYITMPVQDIDIKKYMNSNKNSLVKAPETTTRTTKTLFPERKATVQYFPPLQKQVNMNDYDDSFRNKVNTYTLKTPPKNVLTPFTTSPPTTVQYGQKITSIPHNPPRPHSLDKIGYQKKKVVNDAGFNRGASIVPNLKDFMDDVSAADDDAGGYIPNVRVSTTTVAPVSGDYFDYDAQFRKNIIDRFMEHYNAQNEKFNVDFPVVYNSSIVHSVPDSGRLHASSNAFMRRMFEDARAAKARLYQTKSDPNCERTVELSPDYELHYYVPEDEEKQDPPLEPKPVKPPFNYRG